VTNYHIVFSDWKIGLSTLLPKYDIAIFDEAHEFAVKFRDFRVSKFSLASAKYLKSDISEIIDEYREINDIILDDIYEEDEESDHSKLEIIFSLSLDLVKEMEDYMKWLFDMSFKDNTLEENAIITEYTKLRDPQREKICNIIEHILKLFSDIKEVLEESNFGDGDLEISSVKYKGKISKITARLKGFANILRDCDNYSRDASIVYWLDKQSDYKERYTPEQRMSFCFKPIDVAPDIAESFLYRGDLSCIFTSATISTNGNFDYIKEQTGLNLCSPERIVEYIGESPFNLARQQFWYIPENALSGKDLNFDKSLPSQIDEIISATQGGALCLFTSNKNMKLCYNELASRIEIKYGINSFLQGQKPTNKLIKEFEEDTDSVLFATRTFFTGIDVPGYALRCLVIDKLPFPHLNDPAMKKIKSVYGSGIMFKKYSIPMMVITLKQAVGRGVRSIHDKCVISVLDNRIIEERAYKEVFRQTFPWNRGSRKVKYVQEFLFPETKDYL
jgi:ATP-dependent DNA helicase DinG